MLNVFFLLLAGLFGSASMSHGPAMANDLFAEHEIALPLTLASVGRFLGPTIGPLIGGVCSSLSCSIGLLGLPRSYSAFGF